MKVVCAWCGKIIKEDNLEDENSGISHGICDQCSYKLEYQITSVQKFIDSLDHPVVLVDSDAHWQKENKQLLEKIGKSAEEIKGKLHGDIIECVYADLP
ncbi:MAG: hypothetical protein DRO88_03975, partial [Promethearchaeia archaeon]